MLKGKCVVLGVTGSIAAYKIAYLASALKKLNAQVHVIMTKNACNFINPITFETLTGNKCLVDTFDRNFQFEVEHVSLAKKADIIMIAPASANVIGKMANGIADDMLTTTLLAASCKKIISPAMNTGMFNNPVVQDNLKKLKDYGMTIIEPACGYLACGDIGAGKMPEPEELLEWIMYGLYDKSDLVGKKVVISAGPTCEAIDPVRFITNHSTGRMGFALAKNCAKRGADVVLVSGPVNEKTPLNVRRIDVVSAFEMAEIIKKEAKDANIIIKAAAVADFRPKAVAAEKVKKKDASMQIELEQTEDILDYLGHNRACNQFICGFSMETENMVDNSRVKLDKKCVDMIVANNLKEDGAGFGGTTNIVTLITKDASQELPIMSKDDVAEAIIDEIVDRI